MTTNLTMDDIAKLSGVARSTVRAVLTDKEWVSQKTRKKVMDVVEKHDYRPNPIARSLAMGTSGLIGIVIRDLTNPFYDQFSEGVDKVLGDYNVFYLNTRRDREKESKAIDTLLSYRADGIIVAPVYPELGVDHLLKWFQSGKPIVSLGRIPGLEASCVDLPDREIGYMAADHLLKKGHRKVCFLAGPRQTPHHDDERVIGFRACMLDHGVKTDESNVVTAGLSLSSGFDAGMSVLQRPETARPTAFICSNDLVAAGLYKAAHALDVRVPDDISVVGCDDIELASILGPSLTTINLDTGALGEKAAQLLLAQLDATSGADCVVLRASPVLVERDSVR